MKSSELGSRHGEAAYRWAARVAVPRVLILAAAALVLTNIPMARYGSDGNPDFVWSSLGVLLLLWRIWDHGRFAWATLIVATAVTLLLYGLSIAAVINTGLPRWWIPISVAADILALAILLSPPIRRWVARQPAPAILGRRGGRPTRPASGDPFGLQHRPVTHRPQFRRDGGVAGRPGGGEGTAGPGAAVTRSANRRTRLPGPGQPRHGLSCRGRCATSPGPGAAPCTSAACVTFGWLIRAAWWIVCIPVPSINRRTRIHRDNRRTPPPGVTPVASCDGGDEQRQAGAVLTPRPSQSRYMLKSSQQADGSIHRRGHVVVGRVEQ